MSADSQGRPHPDRRLPLEQTPPATSPNPGGLMPDLRGGAIGHGRDPEEVDPLIDDEDRLRRESGADGVLR